MKKAFTLAEAIITMIIIGVISALMYSNLSRVKPDENAILYKKAFLTVQEVVSVLANDTDKYPDSELMFTWVPAVGTYQQRFCELVATQINTIGAVNCDNEYEAPPTDATFSADFTTTNSATFSGFNQPFTGEDEDNYIKDHIDICVDVNGAREPNVGCSGDAHRRKDRFRIRIEFDGKVSTDAAWADENNILENPGIKTK